MVSFKAWYSHLYAVATQRGIGDRKTPHLKDVGRGGRLASQGETTYLNKGQSWKIKRGRVDHSAVA